MTLKKSPRQNGQNNPKKPTKQSRSAQKSAQKSELQQARAVAKWFSKSVVYHGEPYTIDNEQALAVVASNKNLLVAARAGSGKTRTIVAKIIYLIAYRHVPPEHILAFVFNANAAAEVNARLAEITVDGHPLFGANIPATTGSATSSAGHATAPPQIASTFHAFAHRIVFRVCNESERYGQILATDKERYVQAILRQLPRQQIYDFFKNESLQIQRDTYSSEDAYYRAIRNSRFETLDGRTVHSEPEKVICDYLYEHGIRYFYRPEYLLNLALAICYPDTQSRLKSLIKRAGTHILRPSFYLPELGLVWAHYFRHDDPLQDDTQWFFSLSWLDESAANTPAKQRYLHFFQGCHGLIKTFSPPPGTTRSQFEDTISAALATYGLTPIKKSATDLISLTWNGQVTRFAKIISQFIDRAEQAYTTDIKRLTANIHTYLATHPAPSTKKRQISPSPASTTPQSLRSKNAKSAKLASTSGSSTPDPRVKTFLTTGLECYIRYLAYLSGQLPRQHLQLATSHRTISFENYGIDFSLLIKRATTLLASPTPELTDLLAHKEYLLVDEYQDFSQLFFNMIQAIRQICPASRLFVVGDDWQAINRFAGSNVDFFHNFAHHFPNDPRRLEITTNYRCDRRIVDNARHFVQHSMGAKGHFTAHSRRAGTITLIDPSTTPIAHTENSHDQLFQHAMATSSEHHPAPLAVKYLKTVAHLIQRERTASSILILHRNNDTSFWDISLIEFNKRLRHVVTSLEILAPTEYDAKVQVMTMHRSKGLEADAVIILEADEGIIPSTHQDARLYEFFGETEQNLLDDQKRLFYVALTRAKHHLYILHAHEEDAKKEGFIKYLDL